MDSIPVPTWATRLLEAGDMDERKFEQVSAAAHADGVALEKALIDAGVVREETIAICIGLDLGVPFVNPRSYEINLANGSLLTEELARRHTVFPLFFLGGTITLGMRDPADLAVIDQVRLRSNYQVETCISPPSVLESLIERAYSAAANGAFATDTALPADALTQDINPARTANKVVRLVKSMVEEAVQDGASDIHIEPEKDKLRVRIRVDGVLHERSILPMDHHAPIVSRIKVQAKMDIAETRKPQDGHFAIQVKNGNVDIRVSTIPTVYGENVVLRLLLSDDKNLGLEDLGMPLAALAQFETLLANPHGMILATGPTGSGKTTTLYAALAQINTIERNIITIEDPVEKRIPLLRQTQVNPKASVTFASGLRSVLRQDPDVIMVGEIRDRETAQIAVQAALTGHLVLSTLHTHTAADAVVRLSEMGIPPFLITSSLRAVIAQRLVRRTCDSCQEPVQPDPKLLAGLAIDSAQPMTYMAGTGCANCLQTGYKGRVGIYEMLQVTPDLSKALLDGASRQALGDEAKRALVCSLKQDGLAKVHDGLTTVEEIARVVGVGHVELRQDDADAAEGEE